MVYEILILTLDAGFGHRRAAQAVEAALQSAHGDRVSTQISNPLEDPDAPELIRMIESGYDGMVVQDPTLYQIAYTATDAPIVVQLMHGATSSILNRTLTNWVRRMQPDLILTTHPVYTAAMIGAVRKVNRQAPVDVVITDLTGVHSIWFHEDADLTFTPTEAVYQQALELGLRKERVYVSGIPVHPKFAALKARDRAEIRRELGWERDMTTALVVGSSRSRQTANIARMLDRSGLGLQVAAVAGGDPIITADLQQTEWTGVVHTYGMVDNMAEMMRAADFIICKAGGLIVSESLASGLPLILYEALPGQEVGNVRYVVENGAGTWSPGALGALTTAYTWCSDDQSELRRRREAAERIGHPRAAFDIADRVMQQLNDSDERHNTA